MGYAPADAPYVAEIYERAVVLSLDETAAGDLPAPEENPAALAASPDDTAPDDLNDKLKRAWDYLSGNY